MNGTVNYQSTPGTSYVAFTVDANAVAAGTLSPDGTSTVYIESNDGDTNDMQLPAGGVYFHRIDLSSLRVKGATAGDKVNFNGNTVTQ